MPLTVEREPADLADEPAEHCIFCRDATRWWHIASNNPCCPGCAARFEPEQIAAAKAR